MDITKKIIGLQYPTDEGLKLPTIWFSSDPHFGHKNILKYDRRPFRDIYHMEEELIRRWNEVVGELDIVFLLGDLTFGNPKRLEGILSALNGELYCVWGNHDTRKVRKAAEPWFTCAATEMYLRLPGRPQIIMHHQPFRSWPGMQRGVINIHGHCHSPTPRPYHQYQVDVGVRAWNWAPVSLDQICDLVKTPIPTGGVAYDHYRPPTEED